MLKPCFPAILIAICFYGGTRAAIDEGCPTNPSPCVYYEELNDPTRSLNHEFSMPPGTDYNLPKAWYRSVNPAGGDIPQTVAITTQCNAYAPIYLTGTILYQVDGVQEVSACASYFGTNCVREYSIPVINCGSYRVYCLGPTSNIYDRYCMGEEVPCPEGTSSDNGFTPCTGGDDLTLENDPVITVDVAYEQISHPAAPIDFCRPYYVFSCDVETEHTHALLDIKWYADDDEVKTHLHTNYADMPVTITSDELVAANFRLGTTLKCVISLRESSAADAQVGAPRSTSFFAGVQVAEESQFIELIEGGDPGVYRANYTIPYRCQFHVPTGQQCLDEDHTCEQGLDIGVATVASDNEDECVETDVTIAISNENREGCLIDSEEYGCSIPIYSNPDHIYNPNRRQVLQLKVRSSSNAFWSDASFPRATITITDTDISLSGKTCTISDDPHQNSFDGTGWTEVQLEGVFLMYKHKTLPIAVEVYFRRSSAGYYTYNCGGAVRSGGAVFVFDGCRDGEARRITLYDCNEGLQRMSVKRISSTKYEVTLPTGVKVNLGMGVQTIEPTSFDWENTEGLCGFLNGIDSPEDDKIIRGTNIVDHGTPHPLWTTRLEYNDFSNSYRIPNNETLYFGYALDDEDYQHDVYFCTCTGDNANPGADCSVQPNQDCVTSDNEAVSGYKKRCLNNLVKRQAATDAADEDDNDVPDDLFPFDPNFTAQYGNTPPNQWTEEAATQHCEQAFTEARNAEICGAIPGMNLQGAKENCVADILMTGESDFDKLHMDVLQDECKKEVNKYDFEPEEGQEELPITPEVAQEIIERLCPHDCNGHGICEQGTCICDEGFTDYDCSTDLSHVPVLFDLPFDGKCDTRRRPCKTASVFADQVLPETFCKLTFADIFSGLPVEDFEYIVPAEYIHDQHVKCPVDLRNFSAQYLGPKRFSYSVDISLSTNGEDFSNTKTLLVYDSLCLECPSVDCAVRPGSCHIDGFCYMAGEQDPANPAYPVLVCDPRRSQYEWSPECDHYDIQFDSNGEFSFRISAANDVITLYAYGTSHQIHIGRDQEIEVTIDREMHVEACSDPMIHA